MDTHARVYVAGIRILWVNIDSRSHRFVELSTFAAHTISNSSSSTSEEVCRLVVAGNCILTEPHRAICKDHVAGKCVLTECHRVICNDHVAGNRVRTQRHSAICKDHVAGNCVVAEYHRAI